MNVFDKHQLNIAKKTLKMSDVGILIMGGMTRDEARQIIKKLTRQPKTKNKIKKV